MEKEIWMPHAGHFICGPDCRFRLNTYSNGFIISTVGELWVDSAIREIYAESRKVILEGRGDARAADYLKKIGYEDIGCDRKFETMVFKAIESTNKCCPYKQNGSELDFEGYNTADEAFEGHYKMLEKWRAK